MGVSPFTLKQSRASVVDYLPTLMVAYEQFFIRNPAESYDWVAYTLPLTRDAWLAIVVFSFLIPLIMALTMTNCKLRNHEIQTFVIRLTILKRF